MNEVEARFAARLRAVRAARHWSAQELANRSGVTRVAISKIEAGGRGVPLGDAVALSGALGIPLGDMIRPGQFTVQTTIAIELINPDPEPKEEA